MQGDDPPPRHRLRYHRRQPTEGRSAEQAECSANGLTSPANVARFRTSLQHVGADTCFACVILSALFGVHPNDGDQDDSNYYDSTTHYCVVLFIMNSSCVYESSVMIRTYS